LKVRTALDRAVARISGKFGGQPEVEASVRYTIGRTYLDLGLYPEARTQLERALDLQRPTLGTENPATTYAEQALAARRRVFGSASEDTIVSVLDLALAYVSQGKFAESDPRAREGVEFGRKQTPDDWQRFRAESLLGASLAGQKKYAESEPWLLEGYRGIAERKDRMGAPNWYHLERAREWIVQLYQAWDKPDKVAEWRSPHPSLPHKAPSQHEAPGTRH
jgi:hypothetical protein